MNQKRRKRIEKIIDELSMLIEDEQAAFDALPENLQLSDRGEAMENYIDLMEESRGNLEDVIQ